MQSVKKSFGREDYNFSHAAAFALVKRSQLEHLPTWKREVAGECFTLDADPSPSAQNDLLYSTR